jgi:hypothetical protein
MKISRIGVTTAGALFLLAEVAIAAGAGAGAGSAGGVGSGTGSNVKNGVGGPQAGRNWAGHKSANPMNKSASPHNKTP